MAPRLEKKNPTVLRCRSPVKRPLLIGWGKNPTVAMQEPRNKASLDWVGDGFIHSASKPLPYQASSEFDPKRLMLAVMAQKVGSKTPGPPSVSEWEKSPDNVAEKEKSPRILAPITICHALPEETPVTGVSLRIRRWTRLQSRRPSVPRQRKMLHSPTRCQTQSCSIM